ncbi:MAG: hypothetical protein IJ905_05990 [Fibrobacter sp.]|nr:hypothetical protein [Fibrobacter sp.]
MKFIPPNSILSRQNLACLGEKCWKLQNYIDKSVVGIHFYQGKNVKSAFLREFRKKDPGTVAGVTKMFREN